MSCQRTGGSSNVRMGAPRAFSESGHCEALELHGSLGLTAVELAVVEFGHAEPVSAQRRG